FGADYLQHLSCRQEIEVNRPSIAPLCNRQRHILVHESIASITSSRTCARNISIAVVEARGWTRLVSSTTTNARGGSTSSEVPVNPVCPNASEDARTPMNGLPRRQRQPSPRASSNCPV